MKSADYRTVELEKFTGDDSKGAGIRWLVAERDGAKNFTMRMIELEPEGYSPCHSHPYEHEVFVWKGQGVLEMEGRQHKLEPGVVAFVPEGVKHQFRNTAPASKLEFICVIPIGK